MRNLLVTALLSALTAFITLVLFQSFGQDNWLLILFMILTWVGMMKSILFTMCFEPKSNDKAGVYFGYVAIVIPVYNEAKFISKTLTAIYKQNFHAPIEIVIVDDGSTDNTVKEIDKFKKAHPMALIKLITSKSNSGKKAAPMNRGIRHCLEAHGEEGLIFILDSDTILDVNAIWNGVNYMKNNPKLAGASGVVIADNDYDKSTLSKRVLGYLQWAEHVSCYHSIKGGAGELGFVSVMSGAFNVTRAKEFADCNVGMFGENNIVEDICWTWRAYLMGKRLGYMYNAIAYTQTVPTWKGLFLQRRRWARGPVEAYRSALTVPKIAKKAKLYIPKMWVDNLLSLNLFLTIYVMFSYPLIWFWVTICGGLVLTTISTIYLRESLKYTNKYINWYDSIVALALYYPVTFVAFLGGLQELFKTEKKWDTR